MTDTLTPEKLAELKALALASIHNPSAEVIFALISQAEALEGEIARLRAEASAANGRATDYRTVAINQGWNWTMCDAYGREAYEAHRGEHVDACALNAAEARARLTREGDAS